MTVQDEIDGYISDLAPKKRDDLMALHRLMLRAYPDCKLWFTDGRNDEGKVITNPNIGYGSQTLTYADGKAREFYRIGFSPNTSGISVYVIGLADKRHLSEAYGERLGKAKITGYCIKFRTLSDVDLGTLEEIVAAHMDGRLSGGS